MWIGLLAIMMVFSVVSCREKSEQPPSDAPEQTLSLDEIVAKAQAESANWTAEDWKTNFKAAMTVVAPLFKEIGDLQAKIGDDPSKNIEAISEYKKMLTEFEPYEESFDAFVSLADSSEIGKTVIADTIWIKQIKEELGIADIDL